MLKISLENIRNYPLVQQSSQKSYHIQIYILPGGNILIHNNECPKFPPLGGVLTKSFIIEAAGSPGYSAKRGRRSPSFILQSIVTWEGQFGGPLENEARALIGQFIARNVATPEFCGVGTRQLTNT